MLKIKIETQPDDFTCGPTSLHAVYNYYRDDISLSEVISKVASLEEEGGTLAVCLGSHALKRGYSATVFSYNPKVFDPTWNSFTSEEIIERLSDQLKYKKGKKFSNATDEYIKFLRSGGKLAFNDLTPALLKYYFDKKIPVLAGLNATYLYQSKREHVGINGNVIEDDLKGTSAGHFVVLCGEKDSSQVVVADPYKKNPFSPDNYYEVDINRLINSIMLGVITYDANLLIIQPEKRKGSCAI
ncbi:MAG: C39 family peptidase [Candidatus Omnitrophota bacterium]